MKKKNHRGKYWKGIPEELKLMCLAEVRGTGHYCTRPVLKYLLDHMNECDTYIFGTMPYEVIRWIDTAVEMCLFPLEQHEKDWTESLEDIRQVLYRSEELLKRVAPADYREGYRTSYDNRYECNVIEYAQKLDVYFCVLYMFSEKWDKLQERLKLLLTDTEQNVRHKGGDQTCCRKDLSIVAESQMRYLRTRDADEERCCEGCGLQIFLLPTCHVTGRG